MTDTYKDLVAISLSHSYQTLTEISSTFPLGVICLIFVNKLINKFF